VVWFVSALPNESQFLAFYWVAGSTLLALSQGDLGEGQVLVVGGIVVASFAGTPFLVHRSLRAASVIEQALDRAIGPEWRQRIPGASLTANRPWARILFAPLPLFHPGVTRIANLAYGPAGRRNFLDLYYRRSSCGVGPVLIHLHGGGSSAAPGRKSFYSRRMLFRLAREGWVCISPDYRLGAAGTLSCHRS
jgi:acetyl esterase/lipase